MSLIPFIVYMANLPIWNNVSNIQIAVIVILSIVFGIPLFFGAILFLSSLTAFSANVIQFSMDQLHDAPTDDSVLYVHWYVWTTFLGEFIVRLPFAFNSGSDNDTLPTLFAPILPGFGIILIELVSPYVYTSTNAVGSIS